MRRYTEYVRVLIGLILILVGLVIGVGGVYLALEPVIGLYDSALNDPLDNAGDDPDAKELQAQVFTGVIVGGVGVPFLVLGTILFVTGRRRARRLRRMGKAL